MRQNQFLLMNQCHRARLSWETSCSSRVGWAPSHVLRVLVELRAGALMDDLIHLTDGWCWLSLRIALAQDRHLIKGQSSFQQSLHLMLDQLECKKVQNLHPNLGTLKRLFHFQSYLWIRRCLHVPSLKPNFTLCPILFPRPPCFRC